MKTFSKPFLFGASTASHQVEGGNFNNDWWRFEQAGKIRDGSSARIACDHYRHFDQDFALARTLGHTAHRLSLEWSRIEPKPGVFSKKETAHYREVLTSLKKHRLTSFVTLQHFTIPLWFTKIGGWANPESPEIFARYVRYCTENFGDLIGFWLTINEPQIIVLEGYLRGRFPPERKNPLLALKAAKNLMHAHNLAYREIHQQIKKAKVSFTTLHNYFEPNFLMRYSDWFLDQAKGQLDFIGLDYYHHYRLRLISPPGSPFLRQRSGQVGHPRGDKTETPPRWLNRLLGGGMIRNFSGWRGRILTELPQETGLLPLLRHLNRYNLPIYITENGCADSDEARAKLIKNILHEVLIATGEGIDIRGYLHWTLMDNFEWYHGKSVRMGLCKTDFNTLKRTPRPSSKAFREIIQKRSL